MQVFNHEFDNNYVNINNKNVVTCCCVCMSVCAYTCIKGLSFLVLIEPPKEKISSQENNRQC